MTDYDEPATYLGYKGYSIKRIQKEIEKCVVLCCRCHAEIHYN